MMETGTGFWDPVAWLFSLLVVFLLVYFIRSFGERKCIKQAPFFSGALPPKDKKIGAYWGFFVNLDWYYKFLKKFHNGIVNDYIFWFVLTLVVFLTALTFGGFL